MNNKYINSIKYIIHLIWIIPLFLHIGNIKYHTTKLQITIEVSKKNAESFSNIYYDIGNGFGKKDSVGLVVKSGAKNTVTEKFELKNSNKIKKIRFDPPEKLGKKITIKKIIIIDNGTKIPINLQQLYISKETFPLHSIKNFKYDNGISFVIYHTDPYMLLFKNYAHLIPDKSLNIAIFTALSSLATLFFVFFILKFKLIDKTIQSILDITSVKRIKKIYIGFLLFFIFSVIATKTFVIFSAIFSYKKHLVLSDILFTYTIDILIATSIGVIGIFLLILASYIKSKYFQDFLDWIIKEIIKFIQLGLHLAIIFLSLLTFATAFYYLLSGYVFSEWGAFLEPQHIKALLNYDATDEFIDIFFRIKTYIFLSILILILLSAFKASSYLISKNPKRLLIFTSIFLLIISSLSYFPLEKIYKAKPSTQSPIVMVAGEIDKNTKALNPALLKNISIKDFNPIVRRNIPKKYKTYDSIAKDMNVIFFIMESTRKKNVSLYGYKRETMPTLSNLAKHSLVFYNAVVNQPRSCKTMSSLIMGTYPDPRTYAITWQYRKIKDIKNNLLGRLSRYGYTFYFGTMQGNYAGDHFKDFLLKLEGGNITLEDPKILDKHNNGKRIVRDERILTDSFLKWTKKQDKKFTAILWGKSAHMPYLSPFKVFKENSKTDKYDNCLINIDKSLLNLVNGLKKQGKLKNTLIVIFGDHGEAIEDKMDWGHGNFLYEHSIKIPFVIYNPKIFKNRTNLKQRFQIKDISSTVLYMLGIDSHLNQSVNIFSKTSQDKIYLSNIYQDFKLGLIFSHYKFIYRPKYDITYLFDLKNNPEEDNNIIGKKTPKEIQGLKDETLKWYKYQMNYLKNNIFYKNKRK